MSLSSARPITVYRDRRRTGRRIVIGVAVGVLVGLGATLIWAESVAGSPRDRGAQPTTVVVPSGSSTDDIGQLLTEQGIVSSRTAFTVAVVLSGARGKLQAGTYDLSAAMSPREVVTILTHGKTKEHTVTIPEGLRLTEIADKVAAAGVVARDEFIAATKEQYDVALVKDRPAGIDLEGFLFPDTYTFPDGTSAHNVVLSMLNDFAERVTPLLPDVAQSGRSLYDNLTLASIVEAEVAKTEDRPKVASVFLNRLAADMALQSDTTVAYAAGVRRIDLTAADLATDSPYNTRINKGLPPGPIDSPGLDALRAVLHPAQTDFLYFVSNTTTGETLFAATLDEHNKNVAKTQGR
ncbi:MAG: endolytic transglycosylase MltG [Candidatus Andersenbacteria bacterium]